MLFLTFLLPPLIQGLPLSVTSTIEGRKLSSVVQVIAVMERMDRLAEHLDENGEARTNEFKLQQTLLIYKDFDEQLSQLFADIIKLKAILAASVLVKDRITSYRNVGDLPEIERSLKETARSFELLLEFSGTVKDSYSYRIIVKEGIRLFDELIDCVVAMKRHLRKALSTQSSLQVRPLLRLLGTNGDFRRVLYSNV